MIDPDSSTMGRRHVLGATGAGVAAAVLPACSAASVSPFDAGTSTTDSGVPRDGAGPPTDSGTADTAPAATCTQDANTLAIPLAQHPALGMTGGSVAFNDARYIDPQCQGSDFYVVATGPGTFAAFSASCTHACCTIQLQGATANCPCHGAQFDVATGMVTRGPARRSLPALPGVCTDGTHVYVQLK